MSDILLLKNPRRCPRCRRDTVSRDTRKCRNCGAVLLRTGDTASKLEDEGSRSYYLFHNQQGWVHADHLKDGMKNPNPRELTIKEPPKGYGKRPLPKGCSDKGKVDKL